MKEYPAGAYWRLQLAEVLRGRPVVAEVGLGVILCPAVEDLRQGSGLPTSGRQILLQHECQNNAAPGREARNVLGDARPPFTRGGRRHMRILGTAKTDLGDVNCVMT